MGEAELNNERQLWGEEIEKTKEKKERKKERGGTHAFFGFIDCCLNNHEDLVIPCTSQTLESAVHNEGQLVAFASRKSR